MLNVNDNQSVKLLNVMDQLRFCFFLVFRLDFNGTHFRVFLNDTFGKKNRGTKSQFEGLNFC
jgi:hypothetical protein